MLDLHTSGFKRSFKVFYILVQSNSNDCLLFSTIALPKTLMLVIIAAANARKATRLALLVPLCDPKGRADGIGVLTQRLAFVFVVSGLIRTQEPFVVPIPAMQGLILGGETFVARGGAHSLDHVESSLFLLVQFRQRFGENLYLCAGRTHILVMSALRQRNEFVSVTVVTEKRTLLILAFDIVFVRCRSGRILGREAAWTKSSKTTFTVRGRRNREFSS